MLERGVAITSRPEYLTLGCCTPLTYVEFETWHISLVVTLSASFLLLSRDSLLYVILLLLMLTSLVFTWGLISYWCECMITTTCHTLVCIAFFCVIVHGSIFVGCEMEFRKDWLRNDYMMEDLFLSRFCKKTINPEGMKTNTMSTTIGIQISQLKLNQSTPFIISNPPLVSTSTIYLFYFILHGYSRGMKLIQPSFDHIHFGIAFPTIISFWS